jgi:hypothetical protein
LTLDDRALWRSARTLTDLADLTARWLAGEIESQPGYYGPVDVDEDDAPGMTETLIALNRAGFLTNQSQAGFDGLGYDNAHWQQLAWVSGFASTVTYQWLVEALAGTRFQVQANLTDLPRKHRTEIAVTTREGQPWTVSGWISERTIAGVEMFGACSDEAIGAVCAAWQLDIYDPEPGSNDLWAVLYDAVDAGEDP